MILNSFHPKHLRPHKAGATEKSTTTAAITSPPDATVNPAKLINETASPSEAPPHSTALLREPPMYHLIIAKLSYRVNLLISVPKNDVVSDAHNRQEIGIRKFMNAFHSVDRA